jgi:molecular chaperone DnaK
MSYHLGVDLGTTYTAAAIARDGHAEAVTLGSRNVAVPSVAYLSTDGRVVVGEPAARRAVTEPRRVAREFKRRIGDPTPLLLGGTPIAAEMLAARSLAWVVTQVSTTEGAPPASLAVTHPANWGPYKLDLLRQAIRHVGLRVHHFVPEPVAAATTYAAQRGLAAGAVVAVYDLGGGTFDAALVRAEESGFRLVGTPDGVERLGGIDFDHAVFRHVLTAVGIDADALDVEDPALSSALAQLRQACVEAKEGLSSDTDVSIPVMLPGRHTEVRLTRVEFEDMIRPALRETIVAMRRAVDSAGIPLGDVTAVLLVGGSSRIPLVGRMVAAELGRPIAVDARPKDAVPVGAALTALNAAPPRADTPTPSAAAAGPAASPAAAATTPAPTLGAPIPATPPAGIAGPVGPPPPPTPTPGGGRGVVIGAIAAIAVLAVVAAVALAGGGDGDDTAGTTSSTAGSSASTEDAGTSSTTGGVTTTTSGPTPVTANPPLPGDDWNPEARRAFIDGCAADPSFAAVAADPAETCGCVYDEMEASGTDFDAVNEQWVLEDADPSSPGMQAMFSATTSCALGGA